LRNSSEAADVVNRAAAIPIRKHVNKQLRVHGISFALTALARLARFWHIPFCAIYGVLFSHKLRARSGNGFPATEKLNPQHPQMRCEVVMSAVALFRGRQVLVHPGLGPQ
jgi:hypothetical protein